MAKYFVPTKISENMRKTQEGFLLCIGVPIARTGEMVYGAEEIPLDPAEDGTISIARDEAEVFASPTMASFEGKPVTIGHPNDFVTPDNWKDLSKGIVQNVRRSGDDLIADLLIMDAVAIGLVENGLREVSCGYDADFVQSEVGKGLQRNIRGNHLALVQEGRAGPSYAINDHKRKGASSMPKAIAEKIKSIFQKATDEALKAADAAEEGEKKPDAKDESGYDAVIKACKDIGEKIDSLVKAKKSSDEDPEEKKDDAKDADVSSGIEDRLKALEDSVKGILESLSDKAGDEEKKNDVDEDVMDEDMDEEVGDEDDVVSTGDKARAEILSPGIETSKDKDFKASALKAAYKTVDGKKVIDSISGGKAPDFKSKEKVSTLFVAAAELMKASRKNGLKSTKVPTHDALNDLLDTGSSGKSASEINEINAKHFGKK